MPRFALLVLCSACSQTVVVDLADTGAPDAGATIRDAGPPAVDLGSPSVRDTDGDGLSDRTEGYAMGAGTDTDGDGRPDGDDLDSDGDRIPDAVEALPRDGDGNPPDSDDDGNPDWRDTDSDGNGREDLFEGGLDAMGVPGDLDGDGVFDFRDPDDDGDFIPDVEELGPNPDFPRDTDSDGLPDYRDVDSDNDTILDAQEWNLDVPDPDADGLENQRDDDSDGDGFSDQLEAGDDQLETAPFDTDLDGVPDFLDLDTDDDGVSDPEEGSLGLDHRHSDSDGDGTWDLVEVLAGTDGLDPSDTPEARGWLVALVPFRQPADPDVLPAALVYDVPAGTTPALVAAQVEDVDGGLVFVEGMEVDTTSEGCSDAPATDTDGDGVADAFEGPPAGSRLCWRLVLRPNRTIVSTRWSPALECRRGSDNLRASVAVNIDGVAGEATPFLGLIPRDSRSIGVEDPRCTACPEAEVCRRYHWCPCF